MLTRKQFWLSLFPGPGAGAASSPPESIIQWHTGERLNGQCPVCGTMAEPYVMKNAGHLIPCSHPRPGQFCIAPLPGAVPPTRTVCCKRCGVRFDQDGV